MGLQGEMTAVVEFGGDATPKSPYIVVVTAPLDLSKVILDNLDGSKKQALHVFGI